MLISTACASIVVSMLVNDFMSAPTSSVRAPRAVTFDFCESSSPMRLTARPMSQMIQAPPIMASSVKNANPWSPNRLTPRSAVTSVKT